jgi:nucleoid DNA-binding protein
MAEIDLIKELQEKNKDIPPKYIKKIFSDVHEMLEEKLAKEKSIKFFNFGKIKLLERKERNSRNPKTGEKIIVPKKLVLKFIPGKK